LLVASVGGAKREPRPASEAPLSLWETLRHFSGLLDAKMEAKRSPSKVSSGVKMGAKWSQHGEPRGET
jgi:hypothetical protein